MSLLFADADYVALADLCRNGDISKATKLDLEKYAVMITRPNAYAQFSPNNFPQVCETIRSLLLVRMSEDQNKQARTESRLALIISSVALVAGLAQGGLALWQFVFPEPTLVHAPATKPVYVVPIAPLPSISAPTAPKLQ